MGDLGDVRSHVAELQKNWRMGGPTEISARLTASFKPGQAPPATPGRPWTSWTGAFNGNSTTESLVNLISRIDWDVNGHLKPRNAFFCHIAMPTDVTGINGDLTISRDGLRIDGWADAKWGESQAKTTGSALYVPGKGANLTFTVKTQDGYMDEWFQHWGDRDTSTETEPAITPGIYDPSRREEYPRKLKVDGTILADHVKFHKLDATDADMHFSYHRFRRGYGILDFDRVKTGFYGGQLDVSSLVQFHPDERPWDAKVAMSGVVLERFLMARTGKPATISGLMALTCNVGGVGNDRSRMNGSGNLDLTNSRFLKDPIFSSLGAILQSRQLEDIGFTTMKGAYDIRAGVIEIPNLKFEGTLLQLDAHGKVYLDGGLDMYVIQRFLGGVQSIPILGIIPEIIENVGARLLKIHIGGTTGKPEVQIIPLSADELRILKIEKIKPETSPMPTTATIPATATPAGEGAGKS